MKYLRYLVTLPNETLPMNVKNIDRVSVCRILPRDIFLIASFIETGERYIPTNVCQSSFMKIR